jgi:uncharacterized protein (TIGR00730 family)
MTEIRSICVYCGSSPGNNGIYAASGHALGRAIAAFGLRLVYGGGVRGIMGSVAEGVRSGGGRITAIIPSFLVNRESNEAALKMFEDITVTETMHERKRRMFEEADAFVALPGGIGTVEEIVEIMTWAQLGQHRKPMVFANVAGFWNPMLALLDHMRAEGFVHTGHLVQPLVIDRIEDVVPAILAHGDGSSASDQTVIDRM